MALFKLSMLLLSCISFYICLSNTASADDSEDQIMVTSTRERIWRYIEFTYQSNQGTTWIVTAAESSVIFGSLWDTRRGSNAFSNLLYALGPVEASTLTAPFVLGASLVILGGIVRIQSFRTLGPYFTFQICIRKEHKLVTHGPYAVVRHPAYAGLLMCIVGWYIVYGEPRSWLRTSGVLNMTWVKVWFGYWSILLAACIVTIFYRSTEEDQLLSRTFGKEWERWARKVKYKLVPFVY